ncbi:biotin-(acetyl-CoA carboxylase) ligase [Clostridium acetobutylicum]|uniref:hypothetical protein n=1 Tax=Clostridium acetobutylicum TaxID=1488 RepID=UPI001F4C4DCF|nr:hypothetical protein [Clostridium acetobutylicum]NSA95055.1 biotin-(acetyl-CoA carboxylase) ligase [Clostridium acetobutylicum]
MVRLVWGRNGTRLGERVYGCPNTKTQISPEFAAEVTNATVRGSGESFDKIEPSVEIKKPNDIFVNDKKCVEF